MFSENAKEVPLEVCLSLSEDIFVLINREMYTFILVVCIENRIYIREELKESLGMNLFSFFQPEREFKVCKSCKCSQII